LGWAAALFGKDPRSAGYRLDYWTATWAMIQDHVWLGVGPGNFGRLYPRYMLASALEKIQDPHNFVLETWATCGLLGLLGLAVALGGFFRDTVAVGWLPSNPRSASEPRHAPVQWTFYLGGMAGMLLAFLLRAASEPPSELLVFGFVSGGRALVWFAAFALFDGVPWSGPWRTILLLAGVVALLVNLTVSGGIGAPSVALVLWVMMALALNGLPRSPVEWSSSHWPARVLPVPLLAALGLSYFVTIFQPVTSGATELSAARFHYTPYLTQQRMEFEQLPKDAPPEQRLRIHSRLNAYLERYILQPLLRAAENDPSNATPRVELAHWYGEQWKLFPGDPRLGEKAVANAMLAQRLDPDSKDGYREEYALRTLFAAQAKAEAVNQYRFAAKALKAVVDRDPTEPFLRYQLAETLFRAENRPEALHQAEEALRLDGLVHPNRKLSEPQHEQVRKWLGLSEG
jgi:hypothetical protein